MKRFVALALTLMMTMSLMTLAASAKPLVFTDEAGHVLMTDEHVAQANAIIMPIGGVNEVVVTVRFTEEGRRLFAQATRDNIGRPIRIYVNGELVSSPIVNSVITDGEAVITGNFTTQTAHELANALNGTAYVYEPQADGFMNRMIRFLRRLLMAT
ncbi:MAG: hypothetical protein FWG38_02540 [Defluviitaleaceae bacterium]|nr:hypothetical protein [Defluviitaleaceae bacterium]